MRFSGSVVIDESIGNEISQIAFSRTAFAAVQRIKGGAESSKSFCIDKLSPWFQCFKNFFICIIETESGCFVKIEVSN